MGESALSFSYRRGNSPPERVKMNKEICLVCSSDKDANGLIICSECGAEDFTPIAIPSWANEVEEILCSACGCFFDKSEADEQGFHKLEQCTAYAEETN